MYNDQPSERVQSLDFPSPMPSQRMETSGLQDGTVIKRSIYNPTARQIARQTDEQSQTE